MSVAFVLIFAGALIDGGLLALAGAIGTLVSLVGWFWPMDSQRLALEEMRGASERGELSLAVHGPTSNGWWGTIVLVVVYAIALASLVASYLYLASRWARPEVPDLQSGIMAAMVFGSVAATAVLSWWAGRSDKTTEVSVRRFALTASTLLDATATGLIFLLFAYHGLSRTAGAHAQQSLEYLFLVFSLMVVLTHLAIAGTAAVWAWRAPEDELGLAPAKNGAIMGYFAAASWLVTGVTFYLLPRIS